MSMQLNASNACSYGELANFCWIRIDENADGASSCWERVHNSADDSRLDVARARWIKIEPNHVRAKFDARFCVSRICYAADFDLYRVHFRTIINARAFGRARRSVTAVPGFWMSLARAARECRPYL